MQTGPLTRSEAIARAEIIEVESYAIEIDLRGCDVGWGTFGSQTLIKFSCSQPGASTFAEFRSNEPARAELNGREVAVVDGRIPLDGLQERNELRVSGQGMFSSAGEGLHRAVDPADGAVYVYSMCFLHDASRVFACFDQPDLKATFQLVVRAPNGWKVVSNSPTVDGAEWTFEETPKLPTYLVALAAGPYASAHSTWSPPNGGSEVPLGLYCRKSMEPYLEADDVFATTRAGLEFYTNQFGVAFPFVKYDQLFAPEFNAGAMENAGLVIHMDEMLFRFRCDASSLELLDSLGVSAFADSLPRALTWGALWDLTITAQLPPATFVELVNKSVSGESHDAVLEQLLTWAAFVCDKLVPCSESERLRATVSDALTKAAEIAEPLSGRRLALARGEAAFATTPRQLARVESWLAGRVQQHGLTIDADPRWHVIQRLVSTGRRTAGDIETEFERDSTAFGRFRADRALAAIPEFGAKERAWRAATGLVEAATNRTVLEACLGFGNGISASSVVRSSRGTSLSWIESGAIATPRLHTR